MNVSSLDFRNAYEKFYVMMRKYLWPYKTLQDLGQVEVDIYSAFVDVKKLNSDYAKLLADIREAYKEDKELAKEADAISELIDLKDANQYLRLRRVQEINQEKAKQLRTIPRTEDNEP